MKGIERKASLQLRAGGRSRRLSVVGERRGRKGRQLGNVSCLDLGQQQFSGNKENLELGVVSGVLHIYITN